MNQEVRKIMTKPKRQEQNQNQDRKTKNMIENPQLQQQIWNHKRNNLKSDRIGPY